MGKKETHIRNRILFQGHRFHDLEHGIGHRTALGALGGRRLRFVRKGGECEDRLCSDWVRLDGVLTRLRREQGRGNSCFGCDTIKIQEEKKSAKKIKKTRIVNVFNRSIFRLNSGSKLFIVWRSVNISSWDAIGIMREKWDYHSSSKAGYRRIKNEKKKWGTV